MSKYQAFEFVNCCICDEIKEGGVVLYGNSSTSKEDVEMAVCNGCLTKLASESKPCSNRAPWSGKNLSRPHVTPREIVTVREIR